MEDSVPAAFGIVPNGKLISFPTRICSSGRDRLSMIRSTVPSWDSARTLAGLADHEGRKPSESHHQQNHLCKS